LKKIGKGSSLDDGKRKGVVVWVHHSKNSQDVDQKGTPAVKWSRPLPMGWILTHFLTFD
jgi:hypothetical protein